VGVPTSELDSCMLAEQADVLNMNFVAYMGEIRTDFVWKT
jgi:hypothetical protein